MSLSGALNAAVSALTAQSSALAMISTNLANASTTAYKSVSASFSTLLAGESTASNYSAGGVSVAALSAISSQGLLTTSSTATNVAIDGNGFFVVTGDPDSDDIAYTRNGEFSVGSDGSLVNNGYYLQGWPTDADGTITGSASTGALQTINVTDYSTNASATTTMSLSANLPSNAAEGDVFTSSVELYDSLGTAASVTVSWTKTATNEWTATFSDPVSPTDSTKVLGTVSSDPVTISFNADGTLASTDPSPPLLSVSGWTTGAADSAIAVDLGTAGTTDGMSQYSDDYTTQTISVDSEQDGVAFGSLSGVSVGDDGTVMATYDNGQQRAIYKIAVATFTNANGLSSISGGIYKASTASGTSTLHISGEGGAGDISGAALETSTTDTNTEFASMMAAQQAYSAAAQAMTAANSMFDTLISAVR